MSNFALLKITLVGFCALPIAVCLARAFGPRWFGARFAVCVVALLGWVLSNFATQFYFANLDDHLRDETGRLINNLAIESVWIGGIYALIYYAPFALAYYAWKHRVRQRNRIR